MSNDPNSPFWDGGGGFGTPANTADNGDWVAPTFNPYTPDAIFGPFSGQGDDAWDGTQGPTFGQGSSASNFSSQRNPYNPFTNISYGGTFNSNLGASGFDPFFQGDSSFSSTPFQDSLYGTSWSPETSAFYSPTSFSGDGNYQLNTNENYLPNFDAKSGFEEEKGGNEYLRRYRDMVSPLQPLLRNPIISTLMSLNPTTALLKTVLSGPTSVGGFLGSMFGNTPAGRLAGSFAGSQLANYATDGKFAPVSPQGLGSMFGGLVGMNTGNPYGGMIGSFAGGKMGELYSSNGGAGGTAGGNFGWMNEGNPNMLGTGLNSGVGGGLQSLLSGYIQDRNYSRQIGDLQGLFGQNSSYAQAMREQLNRRDAAAGRRSQYGPREVELQAMLAKQAAGLQPGLQQLNSARMARQGVMLNSLLRNPNLLSGLEEGWNGLRGLFTDGNTGD